jgi:hypothetical protein
MVWQPKWRATDVRAVLSNLIAFIDTNQVAAQLWARPDGTLEKLTLYPTAEVLMKKDFPHWGIVRRKIDTTDDDRGLIVKLTLTAHLEVAAKEKVEIAEGVDSSQLLQLQKDTDDQTLALESMILNWDGGGAHYRSVTSNDPFEKAIGNGKAVFNTEMTIVLEFLQ